jgi:hypothetical protein
MSAAITWEPGRNRTAPCMSRCGYQAGPPPVSMVFITGGGGQGAYSLLQTPDGRPGWAYGFVNQGYTHDGLSGARALGQYPRR